MCVCVVKPPVTVLNLTRGTSSLFRRVGQNCSSGQRSIAPIDLHCSSFATVAKATLLFVCYINDFTSFLF